MKTFLKKGTEWIETKDKRDILDAPEGEYVFGETTQDAVDYINKHFNKLHPDYIIVKYWKNWRDSHGQIEVLRKPELHPDTGYERGIELAKKGPIEVQYGVNFMNRWEIESGHDMRKFGLVQNYDTISYDPKRAKGQLRYQNRKTVARDDFINIQYIHNASYCLERETLGFNLRQRVHLSFKVQVNDYDPVSRKYLKKKAACTRFMALTDVMNMFYGKFSYRKIAGFQTFKELWKKMKPKSAKATYVTQELFDFMQIEITKRKPKNSVLKPKWKSKGDQRDGGDDPITPGPQV